MITGASVWSDKLARAIVAMLFLVTNPASAPALPQGMTLGVATHFDQGWPLSALGSVDAVGIRAIRDDLPWGKGEPVPGHYAFDAGTSAYIRAACNRGIDVLLMVDPRNRSYDDNATAHTPGAQAAFARYLDALLDHFTPKCVVAIEVANEINGTGLRVPKGIDPVQAYADLLATIHRIVKPSHPGVAILGGSTNTIGTGYLEALFAKGALANMDGVVVHPYRDHPEAVDIELARLDAAMRRHGGPKPVWATEFGDEVDDPALSPSLMIRMLCLLSAAGVQRAYWYALRDEPSFRNVGLYDGDRLKPAGAAATTVMRLLPGSIHAIRIDTGDSGTFLYRLAEDRHVLWGTPRPIRITGPARAFDAQGRAIPLPTAFSADPVIVTGAIRYQLGPDPVIADSLYGYGRPPWSYLARRRSGAMQPLAMIDWDWTSYYGAPSLRPLEIGAHSAIAAGDGGNPLAAVIRYTAPAAQTVLISACLSKRRAGDGMTIVVYRNDRPIYTGLLVDRLVIPTPRVTLARGDRLDFVYGPNGTAGNDALQSRIRLIAPGSQAIASCG